MFLLLILLAFAQVPLRPTLGGTITGTLRGSDGMPLAGVRVAAVAPPETLNEPSASAAMSIAETDDKGRYTLHDVPPGRYYIAAGRLDFPTYYPGSQDIGAATAVPIVPGQAVHGIRFAMSASSLRTPPFGLVTLPMQVRMEGAGKLPVFSAGSSLGIQFRPLGGERPTDTAIHSNFVELNASTPYDVEIYLPTGYVVRSSKYGASDLTRTKLVTPPPGPPLTITMSPAVLSIVIGKESRSIPPTGVRVTGRARSGFLQSIYLSGVPGTSYVDGSFEFEGVPPGRHVLSALDIPTPLGALIAVGTQNVDGIELAEEVPIVPSNMFAKREPEALGSLAAGTTHSLASLRGIVREEASGKPVSQGRIKVTGRSQSVTFAIGPDGHYEIPRLFPGSYTLELDIFGHASVREDFSIETESITFDPKPRRLY